MGFVRYVRGEQRRLSATYQLMSVTPEINLRLRLCLLPTCMELQALEKKVPGSFERLAHRKGFVRYMSGELRRLSAGLADAKQALELALSGVLKVCSALLSAQEACSSGGTVVHPPGVQLRMCGIRL